MHDSHHKSRHFSKSNQKMLWTLHMRLPEDLAQKALAKLAAFQPRCAKPRFLSLILDPKNDDLPVMFGFFFYPSTFGKVYQYVSCIHGCKKGKHTLQPKGDDFKNGNMGNSKSSTPNSSFNWLLFLGIPKPYSHGSTSVLSITTHCTWLKELQSLHYHYCEKSLQMTRNTSSEKI